MKLLFLDIDGVLNSIAFSRCRRPARHDRGYRTQWMTDAEQGLDPEAIGRLQDILTHTEARIVISSSWRKMHPLPEIGRMLKHAGLKGRHVIGTTPSLAKRDDERSHERSRGREIAAYLGLFPQAVVRNIAILDDDSDMGELRKYHVKTGFLNGLTDDDADRCIKILRAPEPAFELLHVLPQAEGHEPTRFCWCGPKPLVDDPGIWSHVSMKELPNYLEPEA